ncbi:D-tyrosyl-tRNA(Tyr) deacylase [Candidatus Peregrinibacteria bacterium]|nr:D-tyrosyl-tRNA(Tyr) deacylase [Candidatus Peregrinibacteria bacterium]
MRAILQKSKNADVTIDGKTVGKIDGGLVILLGITHDDTEKDIDLLTEKIINLRLFEREEKYFDASVLETSKQALVISQFTLYADCKKGRRPDFNNAAKPEIAKQLYEKFVEKLREKGLHVETGVFGAMMDVSLINNGPVTIILDSKQ